MRRQDAEHLAYAAQSIDYVLDWTSAGRDHFLRDTQSREAVLYRLHTLTQALRELSPERKQRYPDIPFAGMSGFRNVLVHDFMRLDLGKVWEVVEVHVPALKPQVARMIAEL